MERTPVVRRVAVRMAVAVLGLAAGEVWAGTDSTLVSGSVSLTIELDADADPHPLADLTGVTEPTGDQLFASGWWYRKYGQTRESPFPVTTIFVEDDEAVMSWPNFGGTGGFNVTEEVVVVDTDSFFGRTSGGFYRSLVLTNTGLTAVTLSLFHYLDVDLGGTLLSDVAEADQYTPTKVIRIADGEISAHLTGSIVGEGAVTYRVAALSDGLRGLLNDTSESHFTDTGLPFGPGDLTAVLEFQLTVDPGATRFVNLHFVVEGTFFCESSFGVFCDGFEAPEPFPYWSDDQQ